MLALLIFLIALPAAAATITVDTVDDAVNTNGDCSLREAITAANTNAAVDGCAAGEASPVIDVIEFNIGAGGAQTITLASPDPLEIEEAVTIDGATQPGFIDTPLISIDANVEGFIRAAFVPSVTLKDFAFFNHRDESIVLESSANATLDGLVIADVGNVFMHDQGPQATDCDQLTVRNLEVTNMGGSTFTALRGSDLRLTDNDFTNDSYVTLQDVGSTAIPGGVLVSGNTFSGKFGFRIIGMEGLVISDGSLPGTHITLEDTSGLATIRFIAFELLNVDNTVVHDLNLSHDTFFINSTGLKATDCDNLEITNNSTRNRAFGVLVVRGSDLEIHDNDFSEGFGSGVEIQSVLPGLLPGGVSMSGNDFTDRRAGLKVVSMSNLVISDGSVPGTHITLENTSGLNTVRFTAVELRNVDDTVVRNLDLSHPLSTANASTAIQTFDCDNLEVRNISAVNRGTGFSAVRGSGITVTDNDFSGNRTTDFSVILNNVTTSGLVVARNNLTGQAAGVSVQSMSGLVISDGSLPGTHITLADGEVSSMSWPLRLVLVNDSVVDNLDVSDAAQIAVDAQRCNDLTIRNVDASGSRFGLTVTDGNDLQVTNSDFSEISSNSSSHAVALTRLGSLDLPGGVSMSGNKFTSSSTAFRLQDMSNLVISDGSVAGTHITLESDSGLASSDLPFELINVDDSTLANLDIVLGGGGARAGIQAQGSDNLEIRNVTIRERTVGIELINSTGLTLDCSAILENTTGLRSDIDSSNLTLTSTHFQFNGTAVDNDPASSSFVNATGNFWGAADGSSTSGGSGDPHGPNVNSASPLAASPACVPASLDYGDAPAPYPVRQVDDGARHGGDGTLLRLGSGFDNDPDGQPNPSLAGPGATGDDALDSGDDEDGLTFSGLVQGEPATLDVVVTDGGSGGFLNAWIDFDQSGTWDAGEQIATDLGFPAAGAQTIPIAFVVPAGATLGETYARIRVDSAGGLAPTGEADDGEVEDIALVITLPLILSDLGIFKDDGVLEVMAGDSVTYAIDVSNAGPEDAMGATVTDIFPPALTGCTWTCAGSGGATCTASGSGDINDTVDVPVGTSLTYLATCTVDAGATGTLTNTATVAVGAGAEDPSPADNTSTDADTILTETPAIVVPDDFGTIQEAIDAAVDGDTVTVRPDTYVENLVLVDKEITLTSTDCAMATILDGSGAVNLTVDAENVTISCFTFTNGNPVEVAGSVRILPSAANATDGKMIILRQNVFDNANGRNLYIRDDFCMTCTARLLVEGNTFITIGGGLDPAIGKEMDGVGIVADRVNGATFRANIFNAVSGGPRPVVGLLLQASGQTVVEGNLFDGSNTAAAFNSAIRLTSHGPRGNQDLVIQGNTFRNLLAPRSAAIFVDDSNATNNHARITVTQNFFETATLSGLVHGVDARMSSPDLVLDLSDNDFDGATPQQIEDKVHHKCAEAQAQFAGQDGMACNPFDGAFGDDSPAHLLVVDYMR